MSEAHDILAQIVDDRASLTADPVVNTTRVFTFLAEIESNPDVVLDAELGRDAREEVVLHVRNATDAARIQPQDRITFTLFGQQVTFQITQRTNNPANPFTEFRARKRVDTKDV